MHRLRTVPGGWNPGEEGVIEIEQTPGDVIFLSASDTELSSTVEAWKRLQHAHGPLPSLRVANLGAFKQELTIDNYVDAVASRARLVVARLMGGVDYFGYLVEQLQAASEASEGALVLLPGFDVPDPELLERSRGVGTEDYQQLARCFNLGGLPNLEAALARLFNRHFSLKLPEREPAPVPEVMRYTPAGAQPPTDGTPRVGIVGYRAHYLADNMAPFDALWRALEAEGLQPVCVLAHTLRGESTINEVIETLTAHGPLDGLINTTSFSTKSIDDGAAQSGFARLRVPVLQAMVSSCTRETWQAGDFGLPPTDIAMSVALPEVDGRIITRPFCFKAPFTRDEATESDLTRYEPHPEGIAFTARLASAWARLRHKPAGQKRVALILPNYPNKDGRLANGVGLDTPESVVRILHTLRAAGYALPNDLPADSDALMQRLTAMVTNDQDALPLKDCEVQLEDAVFRQWLERLSPALRQRIEDKWGSPEEDPYFQQGQWRLSGIRLGHCWVAIQPSRGFNLNPAEAYHSPDLPPPWNYLAFYAYLASAFAADAVVHVGKHGNLEWLPGKSLALHERSCFPAALLDAIPHFYPFIVNDPGEGTQAKRRTHTVIVDHLMPPLTRAETYGPLIELEQKIDEYYEACDLDRDRAELLRGQILQLLDTTHLRVDLGLESDNLDEVLYRLDGYLCEIKEAQIRDGLHILGQVPEGDCLLDTLIALHRLPTGGAEGVTQALARDLELDFDPLNVAPETPLAELGLDHPGCRIAGDLITALEEQVRAALQHLLQTGAIPIDQPRLAQVFVAMRSKTLPHLAATTGEIDALLQGLEGGFIDSGPSGAPSRGRLDVLPTGRNFYSVDLRAIPTRAAWELGQRSAERLVQRYIQENGEYPRTLALSVWGTSTMRTGGDDIAQAFALMGVRPIWQGVNQRVVDFEVLSLAELRRPRVDVTLRISGFFRDAFPDVISLYQAAVRKVAEEDEAAEDNPLRQAWLDDRQAWQARGINADEASERGLFRVFGSKPGSYGAGLQELIANRNWETREDLAQAYLTWGAYAYRDRQRCVLAPESFKQRLKDAQIILQNQDNREHDILDSDDYYQFHGGMTNAAEVFSGQQKQVYFGDHARPENPRIKTLKEEILKVHRSRVVNPKWIQGVQRHGYKGAFEMAATVDYLFAFDCTTRTVEDFVYEDVVNAYLLNEENRQFLEQHNPWALKDISERMLEAIERGLWKKPSPAMQDTLRNLVLDSEGQIEDRL
ncbi:MAG: cobaltochelatase CobN [Puniceicoccaceae bacterium 5H]|nr:MAG: cobaltochelatase CobN [Puniceicoccaceae bacterium 5H]